MRLCDAPVAERTGRTTDAKKFKNFGISFASSSSSSSYGDWCNFPNQDQEQESAIKSKKRSETPQVWATRCAATVAVLTWAGVAAVLSVWGSGPTYAQAAECECSIDQIVCPTAVTAAAGTGGSGFDSEFVFWTTCTGTSEECPEGCIGKLFVEVRFHDANGDDVTYIDDNGDEQTYSGWIEHPHDPDADAQFWNEVGKGLPVGTIMDIQSFYFKCCECEDTMPADTCDPVVLS